MAATTPLPDRRLAHPSEWRLTGWHVLAITTLFFVTIFVANGFLVYFAIGTFSGSEVQSSYQAGREFQAEIDAARAQVERRWRVDAHVERAADATASIRVSPKDAVGAPIAGLTLTMRLERPTDRHRDQSLILSEMAPGIYTGTLANVVPGQWEVVIEARKAGERLYLSRNRTVLP